MAGRRRKKRTLRPRTPSRVRKRRARTRRSHHHPELIGLGLAALGLFLAAVLYARPERIVLMGGAIAVGNVTPAAEFNIWADPEAADRVFRSGLDVTMVGLDVTHKALVEADPSASSAEWARRRGVARLLLAVPPRDLRLRGLPRSTTWSRWRA